MITHPFLTLIEQHSSAINRICHSFCHSTEDWEDLRQDIILNLWIGWKDYRPHCKTITWVWRIAMNTAISWQRKKIHQIETMPLEGLDIPHQIDSQEAIEELNALIQQLPPKDKKLLRLYLEGWKQQELAQMLSTTETNIQTRIARIKKKLSAISNNQ